MSHGDTPEKRQRVKIGDVAAALGVAISTVSNAYNRPDQLSAELRARVLETADQLGYPGPDPVARSLRQQRADAVGVLFAERLSYAFSDPAAVQVLSGIAQVLETAKLGLLLIPGRADTRAIARQALVDGFVLYSMLEHDPLVEAALSRRLPTVLLDQPERQGVPAVTVDDVDGARQAAEHLLQLGHRHFAIITDRLSDALSGAQQDNQALLHAQAEHTFFAVQSRFRGYRQAFEQANIAWDDVMIYECADNTEADGAAAAQAIIDISPRPTAILCITDRLALGALAACSQAGLRVPNDLSIVGFDDIPAAVRSSPPLTTVRQDHIEKGRIAGQTLISLLRGSSVPERTMLPVMLVVRGSTGPAKQS